MQIQNVEDVYPLSPMQEGILFHSRYAPQAEIYFEQFAYIFQGNLDVLAFKEAWQRVVSHHTVLRTLFAWEKFETPLQVVRQQVELPWSEQDWRQVPPSEQNERLQAELQADRAQGFDLTRAPLLRLRLVRLSERTTHFTWSFHHLLLDGWSATIVLGQVFACYEASQRGRALSLPASRSYRDYIAWLQQQDLSQAEQFWRHALRGFTASTPLGVDHTSNAEAEPDYQEWTFHLPTGIMGALQTLARQEQLTLNTLIQGAWALLLSRYSGETDVVFGVTVSGRPPALAGVESMVGLFINTLPMRVQVGLQQRLLPWLQELQAQQAEARQYEHSPLVQVLGWSEVPRGQSLFESLLVFENYPFDDSAVQESSLEIRNAGVVEWTNYPLTIVVVPEANMLVRISYMRDRFDTAAIQRMARHFQTVLEGMASHPECQLADLQLLSGPERQQMLVDWNATRRDDYPNDVCLSALFERQVERSPDALALMCAEAQLSYGELDACANQLAHYLQRLGLRPEGTVALCLERSPEQVIAVLGVLKAGGAYVPLDSFAPRERLAFQLQDARVSLVLTDPASRVRLPEQICRVVDLENEALSIAQESRQPGRQEILPEQLAYVIYTSGSTGQPKGVMIAHRGLINYLCWAVQAYRVDQGQGSVLHSALSFDLSVTALFTPLLVGQSVCLLPEEQDIELLGRALRESRGLSLVKLTPAHLDVLAQQLQQEQVADCTAAFILGGEALRYEQLAFWRQHAPQTRLINEYGPTETVVGCCTYEVGEETLVDTGAVPIGRPIANTQLYVLDQRLQPVPIGVPGELYIGGAGVARGYFQRPELTAERFVPHPFSPEAGARLYRSGDRTRYRSDGTIEYLGRTDTQVKLRGYRIELGEIEVVLSQHPGVRTVAVMMREEVVGDQRLVAYVVGEPGQVEVSAGELRRYLQQHLPEYMLPARFVMLEALPLTPNGKIDRRALPALDQVPSERERAYEAPRTPTEERLAPIWAQVLRQERVGVHDNFFELGGHSLLAMQIVVRIRQVFQVDMPLRSLFQTPTVAGLAEQIKAAGQASQAPRMPSIKRLPRTPR